LTVSSTAHAKAKFGGLAYDIVRMVGLLVFQEFEDLLNYSALTQLNMLA